MALAVPPKNDRKRVKVYELRENDWFDRGTGFCTGQVINVSNFTVLDYHSSIAFHIHWRLWPNLLKRIIN